MDREETRVGVDARWIETEVRSERRLLRHAGRALGAVRSEADALARRCANGGADRAAWSAWLVWAGQMRLAAAWLAGGPEPPPGPFAAGRTGPAGRREVLVRPPGEPAAQPIAETSVKGVERAAVAWAVAAVTRHGPRPSGRGAGPRKVLRIDLKGAGGEARYALTASVGAGGVVAAVDAYEQDPPTGGGRTRRLRIGADVQRTLAWFAAGIERIETGLKRD